MEKLFSIEEANNTLPYVSHVIASIMSCWLNIVELRTKMESLEKNRNDNADKIKRIKNQLNCLIDKINGYTKEIEEIGAFVEEFKRGVVNFPTLYHGRKVFLCWMHGEDKVERWHEIDEGFSDRFIIRHPSAFLQREVSK